MIPVFQFHRVQGTPPQWVLHFLTRMKRGLHHLVAAVVMIVFAIQARRNRAWWRAIDAEWEKYRAIQEATDETRWQS